MNLHPYSQIASRDNSEFPIHEFFQYPHLFAVDWREAEDWMLELFITATGISPDGASLSWDDKTKVMNFTVRDRTVAIPSTGGISAQHGMLMALQTLYGDTHSIRHLNHVTGGDTVYVAVETNVDWQELDSSLPLVRWFFTPIQALPDVFQTPFDELSAIGARYAEA